MRTAHDGRYYPAQTALLADQAAREFRMQMLDKASYLTAMQMPSINQYITVYRPARRVIQAQFCATTPMSKRIDPLSDLFKWNVRYFTLYCIFTVGIFTDTVLTCR